MNEMKFRAVDEAHSKAIQQALFDVGYMWYGDMKPIHYKPTDTHASHIYANGDGRLTWSGTFTYFEKKNYPEYLLHRGELVEAGGFNPTFEEQQERLHRPVETEIQVPLPKPILWTSIDDCSACATGDFSGLEARVLKGDWILRDEMPFVDVPEVENVGKRQHVLRSWSMFFQGILDGDRTSDIRWTGDRHFIVGDYLLLQEYDSAEQCYTGREQRVQITYIQQNKSNPCAISHLALADDYAVLSIKLV